MGVISFHQLGKGCYAKIGRAKQHNNHLEKKNKQKPKYIIGKGQRESLGEKKTSQREITKI